ncbi:MAG: D-alanyl-D-alanine carboxypeptidase/D-alanyl-D-alanine-endopeptidase [Proteobacteria bacterium]|nr:D-alanyl-D-alanine carboxypeptidase/D-alanyl-D-alanine-endopeptidase [Pseudomonadota bacterium]MBS0495031.1 D-alanyl-D-alanine carboxypeptidase/D-alanyl-D-alanine-endopeptidase [Pseudomonadota bacterium]
MSAHPLISVLRLAAGSLLALLGLSACAANVGPPEADPSALPPTVLAALQRARLPQDALAALVVPVDGRAAPRLAHRAEQALNPASVMKLVTTYAALDMLGPAFTWDTPVYLDAAPQGGRLRGNVYIQGQGDPKLVLERLWLLMRRLRALGIDVVEGDIVLDRSAFVLPAHDAAEFDGEPWRPYNAAPDALLINYKALAMDFRPDAAAGVAHVHYAPPLAGVELPASVPLAAPGQACGDWRTALRGQFDDAARVSFAGAYPLACGAREWSVATADPAGYAARAVAGMWREVGGRLTGRVRDGQVPAGLQPVLSNPSPALAEVVRDINKYSNNVMTQQLLLTLGLQKAGQGSFEAARSVLAQWWRARVGTADSPVVDNGAGLSRDARLSPQALARMLQRAWASPVMPEFMASLPMAGVDGTLRRRPALAAGGAHLKTGSLRDVTAIAGYVLGASGRRYVLVAMVNHPNAAAARPALDALIDWGVADAYFAPNRN